VPRREPVELARKIFRACTRPHPRRPWCGPCPTNRRGRSGRSPWGEKLGLARRRRSADVDLPLLAAAPACPNEVLKLFAYAPRPRLPGARCVPAARRAAFRGPPPGGLPATTASWRRRCPETAPCASPEGRRWMGNGRGFNGAGPFKRQAWQTPAGPVTFAPFLPSGFRAPSSRGLKLSLQGGR